MARKVFISFLGTNNYLQTRYKWSDGTLSSPVRFIQEAILEKIAKDWTAEDRIFVFYTEGEEGSYKLNWLNNGQTRFNEKDTKDQEIEKVGLEQRLNELNFNAKVEGVAIPEGFSEEDVWEIFNIVYGKLKENDQIFFDITHAFRSIPLFASTLFNFAQYMLGVEVVSVNYGAFEKLGPAYKVKDFPINERVAPIVDMTNIVRLQKLTETATSITEFGRIKALNNVIEKNKPNDEINEYIENVSDAIGKLDESIQTCRINDLKSGQFYGKFKCSFKKAKSGLSIPVKRLLDRVNVELNDFVTANDFKNVEAAIKWTRKHEMLSQAATLGQEYIISYVVDYAKKQGFENPYLKLSKEDKEKRRKDKKILYRDFIGSILGIKEEDIAESNFKNDLEVYVDLRERLFGLALVRELRPDYDQLREVRNSLNHGKGDKSYDELKSAFDDAYTKCLDVIHKYPLT